MAAAPEHCAKSSVTVEKPQARSPFMKKLFLHGAILLAAFSPAAAAPKVDIASFSTVLTEIAQRVGEEHVVVHGLVRPGIDPHEYEPTPADLKQVSGARLILTNGRHLENYLNKLQAASGGRADLLKVGDELDGLTADPHWWNSVRYVEQATRIVRDKLSALDPGRCGGLCSKRAELSGESGGFGTLGPAQGGRAAARSSEAGDLP